MPIQFDAKPEGPDGFKRPLFAVDDMRARSSWYAPVSKPADRQGARLDSLPRGRMRAACPEVGSRAAFVAWAGVLQPVCHAGFEVDEAGMQAKFRKKLRRLVVTVPVIRDLRPHLKTEQPDASPSTAVSLEDGGCYGSSGSEQSEASARCRCWSRAEVGRGSARSVNVRRGHAGARKESSTTSCIW